MGASTIMTLCMIEGILRLTHQYATFNAATELSWMRNNPHDLSQFFTIDPDFGFRPILGKGGYTPYGTLPNASPLEKRSGIIRLLFIVLVLPLMKPYEQWSAKERAARTTIISILQNLQIRYFDLYEPFQMAVKTGKTLQESPGDTAHPSTDIAKVFAEYLAHHQFL